MIEIKHTCCKDAIITNETVLFLDGSNGMASNLIMAYFGKTAQVVLVSTDENIVAQYAPVLPHACLVIHASSWSTYCLLQFSQLEIVGPVQSDLMQWAALFNSKAKRRLYSTGKTSMVKNGFFQNEGDPRNTV
jgi:hypothetical protein